MFTLRYSDVKTVCAKALNMSPGDARVIDYLNRAVERLLMDGKWKGTVQTFRLCVDAGNCIVWPREMETIEAIALCDSPRPIESQWYEFNENGFGQSAGCLCGAVTDRDEVCSFDNVLGTSKKLAVFCDRTEGAGKYINLQFYNEFGQWVTSEFNGAVIDGEQIEIPATAGTYNYTTNTVKPGGLIRVSKDITLGVVRLYEYNTLTAALKPLAYYQPDEEVPVYRRTLVPGLENSSCEQQKVTVRAKLRFIPVRVDGSFVMISHKEALRCACKAVLKEEQDVYQEADTNWGIAYRLLNAQLNHHNDGQMVRPRFAPSSIWGGGGAMVQ